MKLLRGNLYRLKTIISQLCKASWTLVLQKTRTSQVESCFDSLCYKDLAREADSLHVYQAISKALMVYKHYLNNVFGIFEVYCKDSGQPYSLCRVDMKLCGSYFAEVSWSLDCGLYWVKDGTTGYCYRFFNSTLTWFQAQVQCKSLGSGSQLASVNTIDEQHFIESLLFGFQSPALWIGINSLNTGSGYHWTDGSPFRYINWAPGEPNNVFNNEHCGELITGGSTKGKWNDVDCNESRGYICKKPSPGMPTVAMTTLPPTPAGRFYGCPSDQWKPYQGSCYLFVSPGTGWANATQYCVLMRGKLASIADENEQNFVFSQLPAKTDLSQYWIGLNDILNQMDFMWADGSKVQYTNWAEYEPNNSFGVKEDCVGMFLKDGTWNDNDCKNPLSGFICKAHKRLMNVGTPQADLGSGCSASNALALGYNCYLFWQTTKTWASALGACQASGGNLAVIHDRYQQAFLSSQIAGTGGFYWISLGNGSTSWVTAETVEYTAWAANYTTTITTGSSHPTCFAMKTQGPGVGLWVSANCTTVNKYICQYPRTGFSTTSTTTTTTTTPLSCPDSWHLNNGYCYKGFADKKTWFDARGYCEAMGADLISVHSRSEETFAFSYTVTQAYSYEASYWIGANDLDVEKGYKWTDGSAWTYTNWNTGEPNDKAGTDDCVEYNKSPGVWNDNSCYVAKPFVCKLQLGKQLKTFTYTAAPTVSASCAGSPGWYLFNGSCYYLSSSKYQSWSDIRKTWYDARSYCMQHGGDLASVHSEQENGFITSLVSNENVHSWLGMTDLGVDHFGWTDGSVFNYNKWLTGEPNDAFGSEKCGIILAFNGYWNDNDCNEEYNFVCKKPTGAVHVQTPTPTALLTGGCPHGFTGVHKGSKCFKVVGSQQAERKNYTAARNDCRAMGGDIASINGHLEQATVISMLNGLFGDETGVWIGLNDLNGNRRFTWQDSSQLLVTNWAKGQPGYGYQDSCVEMYTQLWRFGKWHNIACSVIRGYICEAARNTTLPTVASFQGTCQAGYLENPQQDCVKINTSPLSWAQAKTSCQSEGANLISILSVFDQAFIDIITADISTPVWIGLTDEMLTGTFSWVDNWQVNYTSWNPYEPTHGAGEGCVATQNGRWNTTMCSNNYPFVCKKSSYTPPSPGTVSRGYCKDSTWKPFEGSCYYFEVSNTASWTNAESDCKSKGMELVSILNREEELFVLQEIENNPNFSPSTNTWVGHRPVYSTSTAIWIGLKKTNGQFTWSDGNVANYLPWDDGQPSGLTGTNQQCVALQYTNGKWKEDSCYTYNGYVCKTGQLPATFPSAAMTSPSGLQQQDIVG